MRVPLDSIAHNIHVALRLVLLLFSIGSLLNVITAWLGRATAASIGFLIEPLLLCRRTLPPLMSLAEDA